MNTKKPASAALKRTNMYFTAPQMEALSGLSIATGLSVAELVRRAVDEYLAEQKKRESK